MRTQKTTGGHQKEREEGAVQHTQRPGALNARMIAAGRMSHREQPDGREAERNFQRRKRHGALQPDWEQDFLLMQKGHQVVGATVGALGRIKLTDANPKARRDVYREGGAEGKRAHVTLPTHIQAFRALKLSTRPCHTHVSAHIFPSGG